VGDLLVRDAREGDRDSSWTSPCLPIRNMPPSCLPSNWQAYRQGIVATITKDRVPSA